MAGTRVPLRAALRSARRFELKRSDVGSCLDTKCEGDRLFDLACRGRLAALPPHLPRGRLSPVTGSVAEAVAPMVLGERGYELFFDVAGLGLHGVDLLVLAPDQSVVALEVKGTLQRNSTPRMTRSALRQMSRAWLNAPDNPGMREWSLEADDLYAGVMVVDFAASDWRIALSDDFESFIAIADLSELETVAALWD